MKQKSVGISKNDFIADSKAIAANLSLPMSVQNGSKHSNKDRLAAVSLFFVMGNVREVGEILGIPTETIRPWTKTEWWADCTKKVHEANSHYFEAQALNVINLGFKSINERFEHGEYAAYDQQSKKLIYKPVSAKDSATVLGIMFDKRQISRSMPTNITQSTSAGLIEIRNTFDKMSAGKTIEGEVVKVDVGDTAA